MRWKKKKKKIECAANEVTLKFTLDIPPAGKNTLIDYSAYAANLVSIISLKFLPLNAFLFENGLVHQLSNPQSTQNCDE
jgi:hypothetical protein